MAVQSELSDNLENYLEVILDLEEKHKVARAKDIAERLNIQRGSVTGALKSLAQKGFIDYEPYSFITLTPEGRKIAEDVTYRHKVIKSFLRKVLQIDEETAEMTACRMEHAVDPLTTERLVCFIEYIFTCPRAGEDWIESFIQFCSTKDLSKKDCQLCVKTLKSQL
jgi:DtxR family Mn-dependent transcriptional regulator